MNAQPLLQRLRECRRGAAAVEFAFAAPLLAALMIGIIVVPQALGVRAKVASAASGMADLVTQVISVNNTDLAGIVAAGQQVLHPNPADAARFGGRILCVTFTQVGATLTPSIRWEYDFGTTPGGTPSLTPLSALAQAGVDVIFVSVGYTYTPTLANPFVSQLTFKETAVARPRLNTTVGRT